MKKLSIFNDPALNTEIERHAKQKNLKQNETLIKPGQEILYIPIILKGCIRILRPDDAGREIFLYHLYPGQTCAMSLSCCQSGKTSMIKAVAETDAVILQIPLAASFGWFIYPEWNAFINNSYTLRFEELLEVIDLIAFNNMDRQLSHYLEERSKALNSRLLEITQQQIADELHTHREAIGRLLRTMEQKGLVKLGRNTIELIQMDK